jgi:hypothetical protein
MSEANPNVQPLDLEPDRASVDLESEMSDAESSDAESSDASPSDSEPLFDSLTGQAIVQPVAPQINPAVLEGLSNQLVWKIGKEEGSERVVVRVGYASATGSFRELPKLRGATDIEVADAAKLGELVVEWIE